MAVRGSFKRLPVAKCRINYFTFEILDARAMSCWLNVKNKTSYYTLALKHH